MELTNRNVSMPTCGFAGSLLRILIIAFQVPCGRS